MKARYEEIASTGGKRAVKKAIEKKQKKISQKEKKSRPFPAGQSGDSAGGSQKRPARFAFSEERATHQNAGNLSSKKLYAISIFWSRLS